MNSIHKKATSHPTRRAFISGGTLTLLGSQLALGAEPPVLRVGLITDLHYADKNPGGSRHYRESATKIVEATQAFAEAKVDFVVELGDLIDAAKTVEEEQVWLQKINGLFSQMPGEQHYVLGNHCVTTLTKPEFLAGVKRERSFYSFDRAGTHFVILDACYRSDGVAYGRNNFNWTDAHIAEAERTWLTADLAATKLPTIVFVHQRLDEAKSHSIGNRAEVRKILEASGKVRAVFQGHNHKNDLQEINGIHYCTLVAMVEGTGEEQNGYSILEVFADGTLVLDGFRKQVDRHW